MNPPDNPSSTQSLPWALPDLNDPAQRWRRHILPVVLALYYLPIVALGGYILFHYGNVWRIESRIRARGEPLTLAEITAARPEVPDDQNAAIPLLALWRRTDPAFWKAQDSGRSPELQAPRDVSPDLPILGAKRAKLPESGPLPQEMRDRIAAHVARRETYRAAVREALQRPLCVFPVDYEEGAEAPLPHVSWLKLTHGEFKLALLDAIDRQDAATAISSLETMEHLARLLSDEAMVVSHLLRLALAASTLDGLERLVSAAPLDSDSLLRLDRLLERMATGKHLAECLRTERAIALGMMELSPEEFVAQGNGGREFTKSDEKMARFLRGIRALGFGYSDRSRWLGLNERWATALAEDPAAGAARMDSMVKPLPTWRRPFQPASGLLTGSLTSAGFRSARLEALRRSALAVVAIERFRAANGGTLPQGLGELPPPAEPSVRADPFGGALKYRRLDVGYLVYSIGSNGVDDEGKPSLLEQKPRVMLDEPITIRR